MPHPKRGTPRQAIAPEIEIGIGLEIGAGTATGSISFDFDFDSDRSSGLHHDRDAHQPPINEEPQP